jgi:hypothetical protein
MTIDKNDALRGSCGLRVAGCGLRVAGCGLRVAGGRLRTSLQTGPAMAARQARTGRGIHGLPKV